MSEQSDEQRDTPLARQLKQRIRSEGPIGIADYMQACLHDTEFGYYRTRAAIGAGADFITAPEISQVFGELIGLWCAVVWQQMGSPGRVNLIELGPGRGTLMADMLRATRGVPGFHTALAVHLIEMNDTLREHQRSKLATAGGSVPLTWYTNARAALTRRGPIPHGPSLLIANEFLDTFPIEQFVYQEGAWRALQVGLDAQGRLVRQACERIVTALPRSLTPPRPPGDGDVMEYCCEQLDWGGPILGGRAAMGPLAALFLDYGHSQTSCGDTLQAICRQRPVNIFHAPGEMDLTAHVDFQHFASCCTGLTIDGPVTQAEFLGALGIVERASRLMAANPGKAGEIEAGVARLIAPNGMGTRFKAIGVRSEGLPVLPGFEGS